ncbi:MAG: PH domain-containing protein, partial [Nitrospiria bacterium]
MDGRESPEAVMWSGQPAWSEYVYLWFFSILFGARALMSLWIGHWSSLFIHVTGMGLLVAMAVFLRQTSHYRLTRMAVYRTIGVLGKAEQTFPVKAIASVGIRQGPLDRFFGIGTVLL